MLSKRNMPCKKRQSEAMNCSNRGLTPQSLLPNNCVQLSSQYGSLGCEARRLPGISLKGFLGFEGGDEKGLSAISSLLRICHLCVADVGCEWELI